MSLHRTKAIFIGLLEAGSINEWIVTNKLGDALKTKEVAKSFKKPQSKMGERCALMHQNFHLLSFHLHIKLKLFLYKQKFRIEVLNYSPYN